jgi:nicotinamidase-related amidase
MSVAGRSVGSGREETTMSTIEGRDGRALLVIDVQQGVFATAFDRDGVVERIGALVQRARAAGTPVVWVRHSADDMPIASARWQIVDELQPADGEAIVEKTFGDAFEATDLEPLLEALGADHLVVTGGQTDACIRSTLHGGFARGYDVTLVADAHSTEDLRDFVPGLPSPEQVIAHTNAYWSFHAAPGRLAAVATADEVALA